MRGHVEWSLIEELVAEDTLSRLTDTEIAQPLVLAVQVGLDMQAPAGDDQLEPHAAGGRFAAGDQQLQPGFGDRVQQMQQGDLVTRRVQGCDSSSDL